MILIKLLNENVLGCIAHDHVTLIFWEAAAPRSWCEDSMILIKYGKSVFWVWWNWCGTLRPIFYMFSYVRSTKLAICRKCQQKISFKMRFQCIKSFYEMKWYFLSLTFLNSSNTSISFGRLLAIVGKSFLCMWKAYRTPFGTTTTRLHRRRHARPENLIVFFLSYMILHIFSYIA